MIPDRPGVFFQNDNTITFCFDAGECFGKAKKMGVILYDKNGKESRFPFKSDHKIGALYYLTLKYQDIKDCTYNFYVDEKTVNDSYGRSFTKTSSFGKIDKDPIKGRIVTSEFDWKDDKNPDIPYENSIMYGLNVRSFTMHQSSKVKNKGTFEGVAEKLDYLKELGITSLVLMPAYEFDECLAQKRVDSPKNLDEIAQSIGGTRQAKVNCWGFQDALFFAPKAHYSADKDPTKGFKTLVREAHKKGIEIIMHFYFPPGINPSLIIDALKFWTMEYHVDGFRISGFDIPYRLILTESILRSSKLWFAYIPGEDANVLPATPILRNVACDNGDYRGIVRRFNKSDEGILNEFLRLQKNNPSSVALINYVCDYDGFTLKDLYTYERKHNEDNGENNSDGTDINYSWNCGFEGESRKKLIINTRSRQIKNIIAIIMLGAGTPYIFSGDEFANSRYGNNNAYCMDNEKGYVEWKDNTFSRDILSFTKKMIALRQKNPILHMKDELRNIDTLSCGYPDLSYHSEEAWRPNLNYNARCVGMFYFGPCSGNKDAASFYVGMNMHWEDHTLAVPKLPKGYVCNKITDTSDGEEEAKENRIPVSARSICIYEVCQKSKIK